MLPHEALADTRKHNTEMSTICSVIFNCWGKQFRPHALKCVFVCTIRITHCVHCAVEGLWAEGGGWYCPVPRGTGVGHDPVPCLGFGSRHTLSRVPQPLSPAGTVTMHLTQCVSRLFFSLQGGRILGSKLEEKCMVRATPKATFFCVEMKIRSNDYLKNNSFN